MIFCNLFSSPKEYFGFLFSLEGCLIGSGVVGTTLGDRCRWRGLERVNGAVFGVRKVGMSAGSFSHLPALLRVTTPALSMGQNCEDKSCKASGCESLTRDRGS